MAIVRKIKNLILATLITTGILLVATFVFFPGASMFFVFKAFGLV